MQDFDGFQRRRCSEEAMIRYFDGTGPLTCTHAPGRLDVMGGVADYSGSLAAEAAVGEAAFVVVPLSQLYHENRLRAAAEFRAELTEAHTRRSGHTPRIMCGGLSPGAMEFGHMAATLSSTKRPI